jgi:hypothetical protein
MSAAREMSRAVASRDRAATAAVLNGSKLSDLCGIWIDGIPLAEIIQTLHCTTEELVELLLPQTGYKN